MIPSIAYSAETPKHIEKLKKTNSLEQSNTHTHTHTISNIHSSAAKMATELKCFRLGLDGPTVQLRAEFDDEAGKHLIF